MDIVGAIKALAEMIKEGLKLVPSVMKTIFGWIKKRKINKVDDQIEIVKKKKTPWEWMKWFGLGVFILSLVSTLPSCAGWKKIKDVEPYKIIYFPSDSGEGIKMCSYKKVTDKDKFCKDPEFFYSDCKDKDSCWLLINQKNLSEKFEQMLMDVRDTIME